MRASVRQVTSKPVQLWRRVSRCWLASLMTVVALFVSGGLRLLAAEPKPSAPIEFTLKASGESVDGGNEVRLDLRARITEPWFVYGETHHQEGVQPLEITSSADPRLESVGNWSFPTEAS